ncbi:MAG: hypothetical protein QNJ85_00740 [Gammaproteobacteria bacterium]|nr:hypothetical protein [Gammaproteobacteria bacterium]
MNRDKKIALFLAPFLLIGGYAATDQYLDSRQEPTELFQLETSGDCRPFDGDCILQSGDVQVNVTDSGGLTTVNSSFPADSVSLSLVYRDGREVIYGLDRLDNPQYWQKETAIREAIAASQAADRLRIVVQIEGGHFLGEFSPMLPVQ